MVKLLDESDSSGQVEAYGIVLASLNNAIIWIGGHRCGGARQVFVSDVGHNCLHIHVLSTLTLSVST